MAALALSLALESLLRVGFAKTRLKVGFSLLFVAFGPGRHVVGCGGQKSTVRTLDVEGAVERKVGLVDCAEGVERALKFFLDAIELMLFIITVSVHYRRIIVL